MEPIITDAGGQFVDASTIGGPPGPGYSPHFYASGEQASQFEQLNDFGLTVLNLAGEVGRASGIKMCYAAMTKGTSALYAELLMAAKLMGPDRAAACRVPIEPTDGFAADGAQHPHGAASFAPLDQ